MTLQVKISHDSPGYPKTAIVQTVNSAGVASPARVLKDGESCQLYVYPGQDLRISEGEAGIASDQPQGAKITPVTQEQIDRTQGS